MNIFSNSRRWLARFGLVAISMMVLAFLVRPDAACAIAVEPGERFHVSLATPIENNSGYRVWGSRYYPGDVLSEKMSDYFTRRLRQIPRVSVPEVLGVDPYYWSVSEFSERDTIVKINLEEFGYRKKDRIGTQIRWDVALHMYVYNGSSKRLLFDSVIEQRDNRYYPLYTEILESDPIYWDVFEKSPYWPAICRALDDAFEEVVEGFNGYRIVGQIVAKAERVDGSLTVAAKNQDKLYHINIGREDSLKEDDILVVTRASSVRTVAPETPEMHFPQIVGRVRVVFVYQRDAIVEIIKESSMGPIQLGDSISMPLYGGRDGSRLYNGRNGRLYQHNKDGGFNKGRNDKGY